MWICNQRTSADPPIRSATVLSLNPLTVMGKGVHKNVFCVQGLSLSVGDRVLIAPTASKLFIIAKI